MAGGWRHGCRTERAHLAQPCGQATGPDHRGEFRQLTPRPGHLPQRHQPVPRRLQELVLARDGMRGVVSTHQNVGERSPRAAYEAAAPESWPLLQARCGRAQAFECMVCHCQIRQFEKRPGDHFEGHFEGRMALAGASLS
jgi:hypothetical protein